MHRPWRHRPGYHEWASSTPVIDAIGAVVAVASLVIGSQAALFLLFALSSGDRETAAENALFFVAIGSGACRPRAAPPASVSGAPAPEPVRPRG
jgi:hypothetical protein